MGRWWSIYQFQLWQIICLESCQKKNWNYSSWLKLSEQELIKNQEGKSRVWSLVTYTWRTTPPDGTADFLRIDHTWLEMIVVIFPKSDLDRLLPSRLPLTRRCRCRRLEIRSLLHNSKYRRQCHDDLREVCGKSKWKFKMAFAMKGGGVSSAAYLFWKMIFFKNHLESFPDCENVFCT